MSFQAPTITPLELYNQLDSQPVILIDVREPEEFEFTRIEGSILVPLGDLELNLSKLKEECGENRVVVICRSGQRSDIATRIMRESQINAFNLEGGLLAYSKQDSSIRTY